MPQVPYTPVPSVRPGGPATPQISVRTGDWGVVGRAMEHLGSTVEASGNELFSRAMALQQLQNETEATEAIAKQELGSGQLHTQYSALQGKNAVDGFDQYQKDQDKLRTGIRDTLSNPMAQRMYDRASLGIMNRNIFNGAGHAATQQKVWADGAANSRIDAAAHQAGVNPEDDKAFEGQLGTISDAVKQKAELWGWSDDQFNDELGKAKSRAWEKRIDQLSRTNPFAAQKLLEEHGKELRGDDLTRAQGIVKQQRDTTGARNISTSVSTGKGWDYGAKPVTMDQAKEAISQIESGGNYNNVTQSNTKLGRALGKYQVMEGQLQEQLKAAGLPSMTPEQFLKDHFAQDKVFEKIFGDDMKKYGSFNEAASRWFSGRSVEDGLKSGVKDTLGTSVRSYLNQTNATLAKNATLTQKTDAGKTLAERDVPTDPSFVDQVVQRIETDHNHQEQIKRSQEAERLALVRSAVIGERTNGEVPYSIDELRADPQVSQAIDNMSEKDKMALQGMIKRNNQAIDTVPNRDAMTYLRGMANDPASRDEFLAHDMTQVKGLNQAGIKEMIKLQAEVRKNTEGDPHVNRAYNQIKSSFGINLDDPDNKDQRIALKGALQEAIIYEMENGKKALSDKDLREIGQNVIRQELTGKNTLFGFGGPEVGPKLFERPISEEEMTLTKDALRAKLGSEPDDQQVKNWIFRERYKAISQAKKSTSSNGPTVPRNF